MRQEMEEEEAVRARRRALIQKRKRRNQRLRLLYAYIRRYGVFAAGIVLTAAVVLLGGNLLRRPVENVQADNGGGNGNFTENASSGKNDRPTPEDNIGDAAAGSMGAPTANEEAGGAGAPTGDAAAGGMGAPTANEEAGGAGAPTGDAEAGGETTQMPPTVHKAQATSATKRLGAEIDSGYAIFIDVETGDILAQKSATATINPASMTKVLTVLVAAEQVRNLDDTFTITLAHTDYSYVNDCSSVGFLDNEVVTVRDLFYGTILPSGGDAAAALADYVAGSKEAFVELMNEKLKELGLSDTAHMTNCVGLYDKEHYCTVYDMAMILQAAMDNALCREVMSAHTYTTSKTAQHPEGITISNWFLRRIEDKDTGGEVLCGKTGYVAQSGNCAASYGIAQDQKEYICVTADAGSGWRCIYDHVALYKEFSGTAQGA